MKYAITILITLFTFTLQAQNVFDNSKTESQREQDLINFIKSDIDLYSHYKSGKSNLNVAKGFGFATIGLLVVDAALIIAANNADLYDGLGYLLLAVGTMAITAMTGTVALIFQSKGKGKIRDVMDYSRSQLDESFGMNLNLKSTGKGVGLVLFFLKKIKEE